MDPKVAKENVVKLTAFTCAFKGLGLPTDQCIIHS